MQRVPETFVIFSVHTMKYAFLEDLDSILEDTFSVLSPSYVQDMAHEVTRELEDAIDNDHETRFVLIDRETGQLESRQLFVSWNEAEEAMKQSVFENCAIGTVLVEM
jgi:hypothetical protein